MAHNPALLNVWWKFRDHSVIGGTLGHRFAEIVILKVGVQLKARCEWGSHVDRSLRCGMTLDEINRVLERTLDTGWESKEAISLRAVDELIASHRICPGTRHTLANYFTDAQLMDVIAILGMYVILGCMTNIWGQALDAPIAARISARTSESDFNAVAARLHSRGST